MAKTQNNDDEILGKAYDGRLMRRLLSYVKPYKKYVVLAILLNMFVAALGPLRPYLTKVAVDTHIKNNDIPGVLTIVAALFGSLFIQAFLQYLLTYYTQYLGQRTIFDLRMQLFQHTQKLATRFFDKTPIGRLVTRVTNDVESLSEMFSSGIIMVFSDIFLILWILGFMFFLDWRLALVTLSVMPVLIYGTFLFRKKVRESYRDVRFHLARLNSYMQEHITGISVVQLFNKEKKEYAKFSSINRDYTDVNIKGIFYYAVFFPSVEFLSSIAVGLIIWYGGGEVIQKQLTLGILFAFLQYTEMFFRPIRDLSEKYNILQTAMASSERIFKLLDDDNVLPEKQNPGKFDSVNGSIKFEKVTFSYDGTTDVLHGINFEVAPGTTTAIVGATGAGKTSIINILTRFYDIKNGKVTIDDTDIRDVLKKDLRKHIGIVLQDVFLFSGTIADNIAMHDNDITRERIIDAAKAVGAHEFIQALPLGYDEPVKERGATLSVGQKQLISFARALVHNPRILILDEATSSVDTETELVIKNAINTLFKGRTSIVIAHRLSTIQNADQILVMHKGEIRERGTHQELLAKKGIYFKLYQLQYKEQEMA